MNLQLLKIGSYVQQRLFNALLESPPFSLLSLVHYCHYPLPFSNPFPSHIAFCERYVAKRRLAQHRLPIHGPLSA